MMAKLVVHTCRSCGSQNIVKNAHNASGSQPYWRKDCGKRGVLEPKRACTEAQKEQILSAYFEQSGMRGIPLTLGVSRPTLFFWLKTKTQPNPNLKRRSCLPSLTMSWKPTKYSHLCGSDGTNVGCGRSCAAELATLWRL